MLCHLQRYQISIFCYIQCSRKSNFYHPSIQILYISEGTRPDECNMQSEVTHYTPWNTNGSLNNLQCRVHQWVTLRTNVPIILHFSYSPSVESMWSMGISYGKVIVPGRMCYAMMTSRHGKSFRINGRLCERNTSVTIVAPHPHKKKGPVMRSFDFFLCKLLNK